MPPLTRVAGHAHEVLRSRLANARGPTYWRALEEIADDPTLHRELRHAFPQLAMLQPSMQRRSFLKLLGASLALAGLGACSGPAPEKIVPRVHQPPGMPLSTPQFYATSLACAGDVLGVLVETHEGRPSKIEGNPAHPASLGATDIFAQAAVLELWDPDRSQSPTRHGVAASWDDWLAEANRIMRRFDGRGDSLHVLSGRIESPTLAAQRTQLLQRFPGAKWHAYESIDDDNAMVGAHAALGTPLQARYRLGRAQVIVALEADILGTLPGHVNHARDFSVARKPAGASPTMNRLYAIEATPSLTGANADHAWPLASGRMDLFARELAAAVGVAGAVAAQASGIPARELHALADDLLAHRGAALIVAGPSQTPAVHALAHQINQQLGNIGTTVEYFENSEPREHGGDALAALIAAMRDGRVDTLLILDGNPVHVIPASLDFGDLLGKVANSIHVGLYRDETAERCLWHLPRAHALECWSDLRAYEGTVGIVQPVIRPLYDGHSCHEVLAALLGATTTDGLAIVRSTWSALDDATWERSLRDGIVEASTPAARTTATTIAIPPAPILEADRDDVLELLFRPDPTIWDGRYANNGWLQELPKPLTQLTWSNAALVSPALAAQYGLHNGDVVALRMRDRSLEAPIWIMPGQAERSVTLPLGYGRRRAGHVGEHLGFDASVLRDPQSPWRSAGATMTVTGRHVELATTQRHHAMEGRAPVRSATLARFLADPEFAQSEPPPPSLYPERRRGDYSWGMSVDLNACIGCNACTIACQAENNIPVVGAEEVARGREMHWIRVDRYYEGPAAAPRTHHQPVPCMHCEHAPCEVVCPVDATLHDSEGLNLQVYNRCVGTRFCSNNCPYKVRRFNFLQYADLHTEQLKAQRNPDVTVRNRGVMEKCTYCIQRIQTAHIAADKDDRRIVDGEIVTACQAACPARAITFGDIADAGSAVSREKASSRSYALLEELNTRPHTTYLASLRNPNPLLEDEA